MDTPASAPFSVTPLRAPIPVALGRGGSQHKYLQELVKRWAEDRGYRAVIEKPVLDGLGGVDVALEKGERRNACEISVTTSVEHEFGNVQKCLASGFTQVVALGSDSGAVRAMNKALEASLTADQAGRVIVLGPETFVAWLDQQEVPATATTSAVRGYRVTVRPSTAQSGDGKAREQAIAGTILQAMKRMRNT